eukprot:GDKJ01018301.1.p1 GENE.GDKJ01018301.1~~GDKJ01018301.1.p1  ORF type:complete len:560 (-),score=105.27 GDKJ01018301.1:197-1876(-)
MCKTGNRGSFVLGYFPFYTPTKVAIVLFLFGLVCLTTGIVVGVLNTEDCSVDYDPSMAGPDGKVSLRFTSCAKRELSAPLYIFYEIDGFFQNQRIYSQSVPVLANNYDNVNFAAESCRGRTYHSDGRILFPCGLMATSVFNDTFTAYIRDEPIDLSDTDVAWQVDRDAVSEPRNLPENVYYWLDKSVFPGGVTNPRFLAWIRPAPSKRFRKLYGTIRPEGLPPTPLFSAGLLALSSNSSVHASAVFASSSTSSSSAEQPQVVLLDDLRIVVDVRWLKNVDSKRIKRRIVLGQGMVLGKGLSMFLIVVGTVQLVCALSFGIIAVLVEKGGRSPSSGNDTLMTSNAGVTQNNNSNNNFGNNGAYLNTNRARDVMEALGVRSGARWGGVNNRPSLIPSNNNNNNYSNNNTGDNNKRSDRVSDENSNWLGGESSKGGLWGESKGGSNPTASSFPAATAATQEELKGEMREGRRGKRREEEEEQKKNHNYNSIRHQDQAHAIEGKNKSYPNNNNSLENEEAQKVLSKRYPNSNDRDKPGRSKQSSGNVETQKQSAEVVVSTATR